MICFYYTAYGQVLVMPIKKNQPENGLVFHVQFIQAPEWEKWYHVPPMGTDPVTIAPEERR